MALFRTSSPLAIGTNPVSNAIADVNGDGHLDLLFANYQGDSLSILLGQGGGTFAGAIALAVPNPREIAMGDLDGDGSIDFIASDLAGNRLSVGLNDGFGSFSVSSVGVGVGPRGVGLADLDGDGDLDFVAVNYGASTLSIGLNDGTGSFAVGGPLTTGGSRPVQMVFDDFNGDGIADIAVTNNGNNSVGILLGNGDGSFSAAATYSTNSGPRGITSADVDGDGFTDLIVTDFNAALVSVLINDGTGQFPTRTNYATGGNPYDVKLGDLDGDGDLDMVVSNSGSASISIYFNDGAGHFAQASGGNISVGISPGGLSLADLDGDGDLDIVTTNFGSNSSHILFNSMTTYSVSATSDNEGTAAGTGGELVFTITRTATSEVETVNFTLGGTASSGTDYVAPASMSVTFGVGQQSAQVRVQITPDAVSEADKTVILTLTTANGGGQVSTSSGSAAATILNDDPNNAPSGTDKTVTLVEDNHHVLVLADFGFSDIDGHSLLSVRIQSLPDAGALTLSGIAVTAGQSISAADIASGNLVYTPPPDQAGNDLSSLTFQVRDNGGTANGGVDLDPTSNRLTFNVTPVNDAPVLTGDQIVSSLAENHSTATAIKVATLAVTDPDGGANHLTIAGPDSSLFVIKQGAVWLKAGAIIDYETNPVLDIVLRVDDPTIGTGPEGSQSLQIKITDIVETLNGTAGADRLTGGLHAETLNGRGGNDTLIAGGGNDTLIGGIGTDIMRGGAGRDVFVFNTARDSAPGISGYINNADLNALSGEGQRDIILDFTKGQDRIDLSGIDANPDLAGDQAFAWRAQGTFSLQAAEIVFRQFDNAGTANDKTIVYGDINRDGRADFQIELTGLIHLTRDDFIF